MGLLRKVGILMAALIRRPFMPQSEKVDLTASPEQSSADEAYAAHGTPVAAGIEEERVADLLAEKRTDPGDDIGATES